MKGGIYYAANWEFRDHEFTFSEILVAIKDRLPSSVQDELDDHQEYYRSLTHEYWYDLLSTIKVKYYRKRASTHINNIASSRAAFISDIEVYFRIPRNNKAILGSGVLLSNKRPHNKAHNHHVTQSH